MKNILASLVLGAAVLGVTSLPAAALSLAPSAAANDSDGIGYFPGGLGNDLTVNWVDGNHNIGLLQFDLSALAPGSVGAATLDLYHLFNSVGSAQFGIFLNTTPWVGVTTDYASRPATAPLPSSIMTINDNNTGLHRTVDVTALVQGWVNGSYANYGLTLDRLDDPNPYVYFASAADGDHPDATPMLVIRAVPEPEAALMLAAGLAMLAVVARRQRRPL